MAGSLDKKLQDLLFAAQGAAAANAEAAITGDQPGYHVFDKSGNGPERFDSEMKEFFSPDAVASEFGSAAEALNTAELELLQSQYALLAQLSRDFILRRRTRLQARSRGIVREMALGHERGALTGALLERFKDLLVAGSEPT